MNDPVMDTCAHNFEYRAILTWLNGGDLLGDDDNHNNSRPRRHAYCPISRKPLRPSDLVRNHELADRIEKYKWMQEYATALPSGLDEAENRDPVDSVHSYPDENNDPSIDVNKDGIMKSTKARMPEHGAIGMALTDEETFISASSNEVVGYRGGGDDDDNDDGTSDHDHHDFEPSQNHTRNNQHALIPNKDIDQSGIGPITGLATGSSAAFADVECGHGRPPKKQSSSRKQRRQNRRRNHHTVSNISYSMLLPQEREVLEIVRLRAMENRAKRRKRIVIGTLVGITLASTMLLLVFLLSRWFPRQPADDELMESAIDNDEW